VKKEQGRRAKSQVDVHTSEKIRLIRVQTLYERGHDRNLITEESLSDDSSRRVETTMRWIEDKRPQKILRKGKANLIRKSHQGSTKKTNIQ